MVAVSLSVVVAQLLGWICCGAFMVCLQKISDILGQILRPDLPKNRLWSAPFNLMLVTFAPLFRANHSSPGCFSFGVPSMLIFPSGKIITLWPCLRSFKSVLRPIGCEEQTGTTLPSPNAESRCKSLLVCGWSTEYWCSTPKTRGSGEARATKIPSSIEIWFAATMVGPLVSCRGVDRVYITWHLKTFKRSRRQVGIFTLCFTTAFLSLVSLFSIR